MPTLKSPLYYFLGVLFILIAACQPSKKQDNQPRNIEVLFLGHNSTHHHSEKYMPILASALSKKGINFTYTADVTSLNAENLSYYDALMIYANHDSIGSDEEKAMMDFVTNGGGILPIHCASYCFRNSDAYVELVGAQFESHGTGVFSADIINKEHPITQNIESFETWDETYVHAKHNEDRELLMERVEGDHKEPWTWTRTHGQGRMFYTASGHDERTWNNPGFQELLYHGILWAVGDRVKALWAQKNETPPEAEYKASDNIANYENRPEVLKLQSPFPQAESEKLIQVPPQFKLELFAQEPDIVNPIAMNWDERGRLWVVETVDYPNEVKDGSIGDDRIKICEDTDGDGKADKFTVFADSLNIPTSIVFANGGVIVSMAPYFLYFQDTDGDDKADVKEVLFTGWSPSDTHAGPSNLKYGFDNQVWGTVGYSGFKGTLAGREMEFGQVFYRFKPNGSEFEVLTSTSNNTWGLGFSENFDVFGSTANNAHSWYMAIPNRYFAGVEGLPKLGSKKIADYYAYHPITQNFRQVDVFGGFTAAAGHNLYTARAFPREYWNRMALVCEPTGHLLAKGALEKEGSGFVLKDEWNLLASADEWVSPVHAEVGPDGAVWVADWYNFIIQHNPTPNPDRGGYAAENGRGNAHINPLRDRTHGRIYRIVYKDAPAYKPIKLSKDKPDGLIEALQNDNLFWRLTAQRLLVERGNQDVLADLYKLARNQKVDEIGINGGAIHALWTMHGLGALNGNIQEATKVAVEALSHPSPGVRKAAMQVLPKTFQTRRAFVEADVINDPDPQTQLAALLAMSEMPALANVGEALYKLSKSEEIAEDLWRSQALMIAAATHKEGFLAAYEADNEAEIFEIAEEKEEERIPSYWRRWENPEEITKNWATMTVPGPWENKGLEDFNGRVLFYKSFNLTKLPKEARLHLGRIDESSFPRINAVFTRELRDDPNKLIDYPVSLESFRLGLNYILVLVEDQKGNGGLIGPAEEMYLELDGQKIDLSGEWKYKIMERFSRGINKSYILNAKELAARFAAYNSPEAMARAAKEKSVEVSDPNAIRLELNVVRNEMKYDQTELVVQAGKPVEIIFQNNDLMQHNLLILAPGSLERVGAAADKMALEQDGQEKQYIPSMPEVLHASGLLDPGKTFILRFTAPEEPGDYPFVCTFPGHWRTMNGVLKVVGRGV